MQSKSKIKNHKSKTTNHKSQMAQPYSYLIPKLKQVEQTGVLVDRYEPAFPAAICNQDRILPHCYLLLIHQGSVRAQYDMQEKTLTPNTVVLVMPGHLVRFLDRSDDMVFSRLVIKQGLFNEMLCQAFSRDVKKFHSNPVYTLTDEQVDKLMKILEIIETIAQHSEKEVPYRHQLLLTQLTVGYEFINYYRSEQDKTSDSSKQDLLNRFCDLVVAHFHESREVQFYAKKMHLHPYYLARTIKEASGGIGPAQWIEQYVITRAKKMMESSPELPLKQIAFQLGFSEPTSFYRYFKHATGLTANQYRTAVTKK